VASVTEEVWDNAPKVKPMPVMHGTLQDTESRAIVRRTLDYYIEHHPDMAPACRELRDVLLGTIERTSVGQDESAEAEANEKVRLEHERSGNDFSEFYGALVDQP
jgi:hypothetical protein